MGRRRLTGGYTRPSAFGPIGPRRAQARRWEQTRGRIKDLFPASVLNTLTRLVLANAVYFKGQWDKQFAKSATADEPFRPAGGAAVKVPMMHLTGRFGYAESENSEIGFGENEDRDGDPELCQKNWP